MLSVRLPEALESELRHYCADHEVTKSQVVQQALGEWLERARQPAQPQSPPAELDLSFLAPDDPIRRFIGIVKGGPSTDELMRMTRGDDWNQP
jgi:hypothetical protein